MITLIFHGNNMNLLLLYRLPYFVFCLLVFLRTRANFVIGLWAVKFACIHTKIELNWIIIIIISKYLHFTFLNSQ
jgi:hypothetical protein